MRRKTFHGGGSQIQQPWCCILEEGVPGRPSRWADVWTDDHVFGHTPDSRQTDARRARRLKVSVRWARLQRSRAAEMSPTYKRTGSNQECSVCICHHLHLLLQQPFHDHYCPPGYPHSSASNVSSAKEEQKQIRRSCVCFWGENILSLHAFLISLVLMQY